MTSISDYEECVVCECGYPGHSLIIFYEKSERDVVVSVHLKNLPFFKRLFIALKYLVGKHSLYGSYEEIIVQPSDLYKFERIVNWLRRPKYANSDARPGLQLLNPSDVEKFKKLVVKVNPEPDVEEIESFKLKLSAILAVNQALGENAVAWFVRHNKALESIPMNLLEEDDINLLKENVQKIIDVAGKIEYGVIE